MSSVRLKKLSKFYGHQEILKGIDLEVKSGEFLVLVGPSGCGKSTSLRLIAGLEEVSSGEIYIDDLLVNEIDPSKRDIAMVFQNYALYPQMTVRENMAFGLKIRKLNQLEIDNRVLEASEILKIQDLLDRKPKELSGGQRQRVALGRAIVRQPKVFLFDEPLSNLDAKLRQEMRVEIKRLHDLLGSTMIYVTHDQVEAMTMGDRIAVMNQGVIEQVDSPENTYKKPSNQFTSTFIGSPQINTFFGKIEKKDSDLYFSTSEFSVKINSSHYQYSRLNESSIAFGIRPEDIRYVDKKDTENNIKASISFIEYLGQDLNIHLRLKETKFAMKLDDTIFSKSKDSIKVNQNINIIFNVDNAHFFDVETGAAL